MSSMEAREFFGRLTTWGPATLVSLLLHGLALYVILLMPALKAPAKRVVQVETISMTAVTPKPAGGGGEGGSVGAPEPQTVPKPVAPPKPQPKPKPVVKPPPPPEERPDPVPIPRPLAMPRPAPKVILPYPDVASSTASRSSSLNSSATGRGMGQGTGSSLGTGTGTGAGSGVGSGRGTGSGSGSGPGSGAGSGSALQGYLATVRSLLERHKVYPPHSRSRNEEGTVVVRFTISSDGSFGGVSLSRSSGHASLDQAAQETVSRVGSFPPIPADVQESSLRIEVPLSFRLHG